MQKGRSLTLLLALWLIFSGCGGDATDEVIDLTIAGGAVGNELDLTVAGTQRFMEEHPNIRVHVRPIPHSTNERLELYRELFNQESNQVDVLQIDIVWAGVVAEHAIDLKERIPKSELDKHFPLIVQNNTIDDRLVGLPWFTDAPVLYYRTDLLEKYGFSGPPETWEELETMSRKIMAGERGEGNPNFWGFVWQGRNYEGLTCNAIEWQSSHGGGIFITDSGRPNLQNPQSIEAFKRAAGWVGSISPSDVVTFDEEESRVIWQRGNAAFMRNWGYAYSLTAQDPFLKDRFAVTTLPSGGAGSAATLGGWQLMVSRYSDYPEEALLLARFLSREEEQKRRAIEGSLNPTIKALYEDPDVIETVPFFAQFPTMLDNIVLRPAATAGPHYNRASEIYWSAVHDILTGERAEERLARAQKTLAETLGTPSSTAKLQRSETESM